MKCPNCGSSEHVTIGTKTYCTNCGSVVSPSENTAAPKDDTAPVAAGTLVGITAAPQLTAPSASVAPNPPAPAPSNTLGGRPAPAPSPRLTDIARPATGAAQPVTVASSNPPTSTAAAIVPGPKPLDLRGMTVTPTSTPFPAQEALLPASPPPATPTAAPSIQVAPAAAAAVPPAIHQRIQAATAVPKSEAISRFVLHPTQPAATPSSSTPVVATVAPQPMLTPSLASITAAPPAAAATLPPLAATQHQSLSSLVASQTSPSISRAEAAKLALGNQPSTTPRPLAVAAATLAITIMGGYIWLQNYPRMAVQTASSRAGFTASLPSYVPPTYRLSGPINAHPGLISLQFGSPSSNPFTVTQRTTTWDSVALLDNYVTPKAASYTTVSGQGLTIYLYNSNQATWINHGVWYSIEGATRLSRDQVLKLAYSL